jgi:hypothetical protein
MTTELIAIAIFIALTAGDTLVGVLLSCVKLKQPFSLQKLVHQLEAQGSLLFAQLGGVIAQTLVTPTNTVGSTAIVSLVYAAAVAGSANLAKDILNKVVALLGGSSVPAASSSPQGSVSAPPPAPAA